jgi:hypothetical protein
MKKSAVITIALIALFLVYKAIIPAQAATPPRTYTIQIPPYQGLFSQMFQSKSIPTLMPGSSYAWQFYDETTHRQYVIQGQFVMWANDNLRQ